MNERLAETCLVCDRAIDPGEARYRPPAGSFHAACYETTPEFKSRHRDTGSPGWRPHTIPSVA